MNLSNRTFQDDVSRQLAELGLEEGLRAFSANDWSGWTNGITVNWDTSTYASSKRAIGTMTFPAGYFGQGTSVTIKLRVDNFDAAVVGAGWVSSGAYPTYRIGDLVGYNGTWYRCVQNHSTTRTPNGISNLDYWVPAPLPWDWSSDTTYKQQDVVRYNNEWYYYSNGTSTSGNVPSGTSSYWTRIPNIYGSYSSSTFYNVNDVVYYSTLSTWIYCTAAGTGGSASWGYAPISWRWMNTKNYAWGDMVYYGGVWYRCISAHSNQQPPNSTYWENAITSMWGWSSAGINYNLGDTVYHTASSLWYRCIKAHTSSTSITPTSTAHWATTPLYSFAWDPSRYYKSSTGDVVRYNGTWYRCLNPHSDTTAPSGSSNWTSASLPSNAWSQNTAYVAGAYAAYGGVWYKCLVANTGKSPNDVTYWTATWINSFGVTSGAPVLYADATVNISGSGGVKTQLRAAIGPAPLFPNAIGASDAIKLNSAGNVVTYDSLTNPMPTGGYGYTAVVGASGTTYPAVKIVGATVQGYVAAQSSQTQFGTSATVKSSTSAPTPKVDPSRINRSPYVPQFRTLPTGSGGIASNLNTMPKGTALPTSLGTSSVTIGTPGGTSPSRYYVSGDLVMGGTSSTIQTLNIVGPVVLNISGNLTMNGSPTGTINLYATGSAEIHVGGALNVDSASSGIKNSSSTPDPKRLIIICDTNTGSTLAYKEDTNYFYGVIYAPYTTATDGFYNDNNNTRIYGAVSATRATFNNNVNIYYDTNLRYATFGGVEQPYAATELRELPQTEQVTIQ